MKKIYFLSVLSIFMLISIFKADAYYWKKATGITPPFSTNYWLDVYFLPSNPNFGWVCGFNGYVIRTTDRGKTWSGSKVIEADHLESISFPSQSVGYTSGVEGIWKSTDGGITWFDVTPALGVNLWGCYFYDDDYGMVVGDGCLDGRQRFYLTTDGGNNWSEYDGNMPNSGMTDVIIYDKNGLAFAVSSGILWKSEDGGKTWSIFASSGTNIWQEEICKFNNSFLLPTSGSDCQGGGILTGGMRFTTDNGVNWNETKVPQPMFGTFLLGDYEGWACGYNKEVYYTSNAGVDWTLKNCGIGNGNLDDIWFITRDEGWVVGEGIYHLAPDEIISSKDTFNFPDFCEPKRSRDTIWIKYKSFDGAPGQIEISNNTDNAFTILTPKTFFSLDPCDSIPIIVMFDPQERKDYTADIKLTVHAVDPAQTLEKNFPVKAIANKNTAYPGDTLVVIDNAYCNLPVLKSVKWFSETSNEFIINTLGDNDNSGISFITQLPFKVWKTGGETEFRALLRDTGWTQNRIKITTIPCNLDTFITIKAYGVSSIINADTLINMVADCFKPVYDTIKVYNTGNYQLEIPEMKFIPDEGNFSIIKVLNGSVTNTTLNRGDTAYIIVMYDPAKGLSDNTTLKLTNNDSTKVRGNKNPYLIKFNGINKYSDIVTLDKLDLGKICVGKDTVAYFRMKNPGTVDAEFVFDSNNLKPFAISPKTGKISPADSVLFSVKFSASDTGHFSQTFHYKVNPCGLDKELTLTGTGIKTILEVDPTYLSLKGNVGDKIPTDVKVKSLTPGSVNVISIHLNPPSANWTFVFNPDLPLRLDSGQSSTFHFIFQAAAEGKYEGQLCFGIEGDCPDNICIPVALNTDVRDFLSVDSDCKFGTSTCTADTLIKTIRFMNNGSIPDTIISVNLNPDSPPFRIISMPVIGNAIAPTDTVEFKIEFAPIAEGDFSSSLDIKTKDPGGKAFSIPITGSFHKTETKGDNTDTDFGTFEHCSPNREIPVILRNSGTLDDILDVVLEGDTAEFAVFPSDSVMIKAGESVYVKVDFYPWKASRSGDFNCRVNFISRICGNKITYDFKSKIEEYKLVATPPTVSMGNIPIGKSGLFTVQVSNPNPKVITLDSASVTNPAFSLTIDTPWTYEENGNRDAKISFFSKSFGVQSGSIILKYHTECADSLIIPVEVSTPAELYEIKLRFPDTTATPGEEISIPLLLDEPLSDEFFCDSATFAFSFKPQLFYPKNMFINNSGSYKQIDYSYNNGVISGTVSGKDVDYALVNGGTIMKMDGVALLTKDDFTPLTIDKFDIYGIKPTNIVKKDGSLRLVNYCVNEAQLITMMPGFDDLQAQAISNSVNISFNSDGEMNIGYEIINSLGINTINGTIRTIKGENKISVGFDETASGIYFIKMQSEFGETQIIKFINIK